MELSVNHKALKVKSLLGFCESLIFGHNNKSSDLLVLNFHGTPEKYIHNFEKQIAYLNEHFQIVSPDFLESYYVSQYVGLFTKRPLLITFDDGLKNNLYAAGVLNKFRVKALFFVIPDFIEAEDQAGFYQSNIRPVIDKEIESQPEDTSAMTWENLKELTGAGHLIGNHSQTHLLKATMASDQSVNEIVNSKKIICDKLQLANVKNFCSPNDSLYSTGKLQMDLIKSNYSFFHSTYPGKNSNCHPYFVRRVNVECYWPLNALKFAIGRFDELRFKGQNNSFQEIAGSV